jgi:hypothetical protein
VLGELGAVAQRRRRLGEQALEAEEERVLTAPLEGRVLGAGLDLGERRVDRSPPGAAGPQVGDRLALEQDLLARELAGPIEIGLAQLLGRAARGNVGGIGHG